MNSITHDSVVMKIFKAPAEPTPLIVGYSRFTSSKTVTATFHNVPWSRVEAAVAEPKGDYIVAQDDSMADGMKRLIAAKERLPLVRFALFEGNTRAAGTAGPVTIWAVEGDYDTGVMTVAEAAERLGLLGIRAVIFTTPRHTREKPRWRVLVPLAGAAPIAYRAALLRRVDAALGGVLGRESYEPKRCFFMGRVQGVEYLYAVVPGQPLEPAVSPEEIEVASQYLPDEKSSRAPVGEAADPESDPMVLVLKGRGMLGRYLGNGKWNIACPNAAEHTDGRGDGDDSSTVFWARAGGGYGCHCEHSHCKGPSEEYPNAKRVTFDYLLKYLGLEWLQGAIGTVRAQQTFDAAGVSDGVMMTRSDRIITVPIRWLRRYKLAKGKLHILAGRPSTAKSTIAAGLAATISRGGEWPEGGIAERGSVVIWSGEDAANDTIVPRLTAAGAELSRVYIINGLKKSGEIPRPFNPATDMNELRRAVEEIGEVKLLILDPVVAVIGSKQDSHKNSETRSALQPVVDLAEALDIAVIGISHFTKGTAGSDPIERVTGSLAFGAMPRVIFATVKVADKVNQFRFVVAKSNIGPEGGGVEYSSAVVTLPGGIETTKIEWGEPLEGDARKLINEVETDTHGRPPEKISAAMRLLGELLAQGPVPVAALKRAAEAHGVGWRTIERAKTALRLVAERTDQKDSRSGWQWRRESGFGPVEP